MPARISTPTSPRQDLDAIAHRVRDHLHQIQRTLGLTLGHILDVGDLLNAAQVDVTSNWKRWLKEQCLLSVSTAQLYQQLARHRAEVENALSLFPNLSLRAARRLIAKPKPKPKEKSAEDISVEEILKTKSVQPHSKLTKALKLALSHAQADSAADQASALSALRGALKILGTQSLSLHDLMIGIQPRAQARAQREKSARRGARRRAA
jgi:hypothetical protein